LLAYDTIIDVTAVISQTDRYSILKVPCSENISINLYKLRRESVYHFRGFYGTVEVNVIFQTNHIKRINRLKAFIRWWKSSLSLPVALHHYTCVSYFPYHSDRCFSFLCYIFVLLVLSLYMDISTPSWLFIYLYIAEVLLQIKEEKCVTNTFYLTLSSLLYST